MATRPHPNPDDELDLPPLDGEDDGLDEAEGTVELDEDDAGDGENALDDRTGEDDPLDEADFGGELGAETAWLDGEDDAAVDVGTFDLTLGGGDGDLSDAEEPDARVADDDFALDESAVVADGGEEGPLDDDEELREEDLPDLDADEGGDVDDDHLFERSAMLGADDELRWDDRAWTRDRDVPATVDDDDDSGALPVPGDDPATALRDATWKAFDEGGRVQAAAFVPGGSVVVALESASRPRLVRILPDGAARIIAEIEVGPDDDAAVVTSLRWDAARGHLVAAGSFGAQAFRPT